MLIGILVVLLTITLIVLAIVTASYYRACRRNQKDLEEKENLKKLEEKYKKKIEELHSTIEEQYQQTIELKTRLGEVQVISAVNAQGEIHTVDIQEEINKLIDEREHLQEEIKERGLKLTGLATTQYEFLQALARSKEAQLQIENVTHGLENRNREILEEISGLERQKVGLTNELNRLLNIQKVIDTNEDNVIWDPILSEKQSKLVSVLRDLSILYPDLEIDFATIEWKKIWMPQLQQLGKVIDGQKGIYRLILKRPEVQPIRAVRDGQEVELPVCYVGQAVNIKDRWYQHVKKMIGVMSKGNEKVYEWRPEDFKWCVVESGNSVDLDYSEKYWIGYFCAKDGLNKKM